MTVFRYISFLCWLGSAAAFQDLPGRTKRLIDLDTSQQDLTKDVRFSVERPLLQLAGEKVTELAVQHPKWQKSLMEALKHRPVTASEAEAVGDDFPIGRDVSGEDDAVPSQAEERGSAVAVYVLGFLILVAVCPVLITQGPRAFITVLTYLTCLCFVKMKVKVAEENGFAFPYAITMFHMLFTAMVSGCLAQPELSEAFGILPIAIVTGGALLLNNAALVFGGVAFVTMLGCCTPACTFVIQFVTGRLTFSLQGLMPVVIVSLGSIMCVEGEASISVAALGLGVSSTVLRSLKSVLMQDVLTGAGRTKLSPIRLVFWSSFWSLLLISPVFVFQEGQAFLQFVMAASAEGKEALVMSAVLACGLNVSQVYIVKMLGALQQQVVGNLNLIIVITLAVCTLHEVVTPLQYAGVALLVLGAVMTTKANDLLSPKGKGVEFAFEESDEQLPLPPAQHSVTQVPRGWGPKVAEKVDSPEASPNFPAPAGQ
eukprot:TRINITY_DN6744_c0_g1_i2.p1 TRINITY_DN6744_c0_g1~~TRINITY_DN6744_c0_g1_i2.p1  ORF type:complete len:484 (-),score=85.73 TRINITY_DN6744_c0_g1_i2:211-1662(-)